MEGPPKKVDNPEDLSLHKLAEKALREAVAQAIAEHKLRGHPIVIWRDGKVISVPPEDISVKEVEGE